MLKFKTKQSRRLKTLLSEFMKASKSHIEVGFINTATHPNSKDLTIADIALINEYGSADKRIPARPFLVPTISNKDNQARWAESLGEYLTFQLQRSDTIPEAMNRAWGMLAIEVAGDVQTAITEKNDPPNAESTIKKKGSSNPLIDQQIMRSNVRAEVITP